MTIPLPWLVLNNNHRSTNNLKIRLELASRIEGISCSNSDEKRSLLSNVNRLIILCSPHRHYPSNLPTPPLPHEIVRRDDR